MALADEAVNVQITAGTRTPSRAGFGTPLILGYHTVWTSGDRVRTYSSPSAMLGDGFTVNDPLYKMAQRLFGQPNSPTRIKVGRLPSPHAKTVELTVTNATEGDVITFGYTLPNGTTGTISYTILAAASTTSVATAIAALLNALTGIDASSASAVITVSATTDGQVFYLSGIETSNGVSFEDVTADAGYDTELSAIELVDDDWYFALIDVPSYQNVLDVAAWAETRTKLFLTQTQDSQELTSGGVLGAALKAAGYNRTHVQYVNDQQEYIDAALCGLVAPKDAGTVNWAWKALAGPTVQALSDTARGNLIGDNVNYYVSTKNLSVTWDGRAASGQYMDIQRGIDLITARIQESVLYKLANTDKIDYTDEEVDSFLSLIRGVLLRQSGPGKFIDEDSILVTGPKVADVDIVDRANRYLPDLQFSAVLRGAVNSVKVTGIVSV